MLNIKCNLLIINSSQNVRFLSGQSFTLSIYRDLNAILFSSRILRSQFKGVKTLRKIVI